MNVFLIRLFPHSRGVYVHCRLPLGWPNEFTFFEEYAGTATDYIVLISSSQETRKLQILKLWISDLVGF